MYLQISVLGSLAQWFVHIRVCSMELQLLREIISHFAVLARGVAGSVKIQL